MTMTTIMDHCGIIETSSTKSQTRTERRRKFIVGRVFTMLLLLLPSTLAAANEEGRKPQRRCDENTATEDCGKNERCVSQGNDGGAWCDCELGYEWLDDGCIKTVAVVAPDSSAEVDWKYNSGGGSVAPGLLIPTFLVIIGVALYFGARRYRWLQRFRQYRQSRYGNVLVTRDDDDDDDSPIA